MDEQNRGRIVAGAVLIVLGLGLLGLQFVQGIGEGMFLFLLGALFVAGYFYRRVYGLLIPGCILLGLGLGSVGERSILAFGDFGAIGLGVGFVAIYVIDLIYRGATHWWPLIPGLILIVAGIAEGNANLERLLSVGWPLILVLIGLLLLAGAFGLTGRRKV
jgi:hypothetical protein